MDQIAPGTYLPSWETNVTRIATASGSGEPRSASNVRHESIVQPAPAAAAAADAGIEYQRSRCSIGSTTGHSRARPKQQRARIAQRMPSRIDRLARTRSSTRKEYL